MKKFLIPLLFALLILGACGKKNEPAAPEMTNGAQMSSKYSDDNLSFDIPESWQKNFKAVTRDVGSSGNTYPQTEFYYTEGERDIRLMTIGKFTREQWEKMKRDGKVGDDTILGESEDEKHIFSVLYENHDYIEDTPLRDTLGKIKKEAMALRDKIMIN